MLVAILAWNVTFVLPLGGLDQSWYAGMHMAAHMRLHFGSEVVWTYGPLSFLMIPGTYYSGLAALGFCYQGLLFIAYCVSVFWALRRSAGAPLALVVTFFAVIALPNATLPLVIVTVWCLVALSGDAPPYARRLVSLGGGAFGALECLIRLSWGPTILIVCAVTLLALPGRRRELPIFLVSAAVAFAALWFAAGQALGNLPDFARAAVQVVSGYSDAMGLKSFAGKYLPISAVTLAGLVAAGAITCSGPRERRIAAGVVVAVVSFVVFKEGAVRYDVFHIVVFFATATMLLLAMPWRGGMRIVGAAAILVVGAVAIHITPSAAQMNFNPVTHVKSFVSQVRTLASPGRRKAIIDRGRFFTEIQYQVDPATLALLKGHRVHVDPWSAAVAWAYDLNWKPLPVFQDYQAYTPSLDHQNARALESTSGPDRILRENVPVVEPRFHLPAIDGRNPSWESPAATIAELCNFTPLHTTNRWQVLGRVANRCGAPRLIGSARTSYGTSTVVPRARADELVFAKVHGAAVSGLENVRAFLLRARFRYAIVNGRTVWRLVPGTAADGLLVSVPPAADFPGRGFTLSPGARTLTLTGTSGSLTLDFYAMPIRPLPGGRV